MIERAAWPGLALFHADCRTELSKFSTPRTGFLRWRRIIANSSRDLFRVFAPTDPLQIGFSLASSSVEPVTVHPPLPNRARHGQTRGCGAASRGRAECGGGRWLPSLGRSGGDSS